MPLLSDIEYRILQTTVLGILSVPWTRYVVSKSAPGLQRLAFAMPVVALYQYLPFSFKPTEEALSGAIMYGFFGWHGTFKVLALCCNRGPLARNDHSLLQQIFLQILPIYPTNETAVQGRLSDKDSSMMYTALRIPLKAVALRFFLKLMKANTYPMLFFVFQDICLFAYVSMVLDMLVLITRLVFKLHICPTFDQPWRAVSIAEFWSSRWNIGTSHLLRQCVYEPVVDGSFMALEPHASEQPAKQSRRDAGVFLAFLVSGIMHEIFQYCMNRTMSGFMLVFFTIQAPLMMVERRVLKFLKQRNSLPPGWVRNVISIAVLGVFGHTMFWPPLNQTGLTQKVMDLQLAGFDWMETTLLPTVQHLFLSAFS